MIDVVVLNLYYTKNIYTPSVSIRNLRRSQLDEYKVTDERTCYECFGIQYRDIKEHSEMVQGGIPFGPFNGETKRKVGGNSAFNPRILRNLSFAFPKLLKLGRK